MPKALSKAKLRKALLAALQKLRRLEEADDNGYVSCVSCGVTRRWNDGMDGGHFIPKGRSSYYATSELNIWPQCKSCNGFDMGGVAGQKYTFFMEDKFGRETIQHWHDTCKQPVTLTTQDYRELLADVNARIRAELERIA